MSQLEPAGWAVRFTFRHTPHVSNRIESQKTGGFVHSSVVDLDMTGVIIRVDSVKFTPTGLEVALQMDLPEGWTRAERIAAIQGGESGGLAFAILIDGQEIQHAFSIDFEQRKCRKRRIRMIVPDIKDRFFKFDAFPEPMGCGEDDYFCAVYGLADGTDPRRPAKQSTGNRSGEVGAGGHRDGTNRRDRNQARGLDCRSNG